MERHFVEFYSPGTFVAEITRKPIDAWDVEQAVRMSREIVERHGARPYGFRFITRSRDYDDLDSTTTAESGMYYLGGRVMTLEEVRAEGDPRNDTLIHNMEGNGWDRIVRNDNYWRWTQPLEENDVVLDIKEG